MHNILDDDLKFDHDLILRDIAHPRFFPSKPHIEDLKVLHTGMDEKFLPGIDNNTETYDYISVGLIPGGIDFQTLLKKLLSLLKPGGKIAAGVYGYAGYYGLNMLNTIIKNLSPDIDDIPGEKNFQKILKLIRSVIDQLPPNHPCRERKGFMERLKAGDKNTLTRLIQLSQENIFTVTQLLEVIEKAGGCFRDWVFPALYDPGQYIEDKEITEKIASLPLPQRCAAAELIDAWPPEHYFFVDLL
jgi:hypothetical protein